MCHWPVSHSQTGRNNVGFFPGISPRASCNTQCTVDTPDEWRGISAIWENLSIAYHTSSKLFFFFWLTLQTNFEATWKQTVTWIIMFISSRSPFIIHKRKLSGSILPKCRHMEKKGRNSGGKTHPHANDLGLVLLINGHNLLCSADIKRDCLVKTPSLK